MSDGSNDTGMRRRQIAAWLTEQGFPIAPSTLAKLASTGGGPEFESFGRIPIYRPSKALAWARSRTRVRKSTSDPGRPLGEAA